MNREDVLSILKSHSNELREFDVQSLSVFGSFARDEARPDSDVDILVEFTKPVGLFTFVRLQAHLEKLMGRHIDLVTPDALKHRLKERILREAVRAA